MVRAPYFVDISISSHEIALALDKPPAEEDNTDNAQTIRPTRSPSALGTAAPLPVAKAPEPQIEPIAEDYSDMVFDEDEAKLEEKVADFKVCLRTGRCFLAFHTHLRLYR